ncbi:MAG: 50S ribosomal protein L11 methyltransferase [Armatimonadetes bacterium]|nr:50S ribosomal protein L11 methyltransferase [Armatimonadota bacterium]
MAPRWFGDVATHVRMLWDYTRTSAYREAISRNVRGKTVLEIGCGTGILACFAAIAGAKHVYAIEESAIISVAREITKANGLQEVITLIPGNSTDAELPEKVDLIYSEIIGINPLEERLIPTLSDGVSRFLKPGGTTMPSHFSLWVAGIESDLLEERYLRAEEHTAVVERFSEVYGLDLSSIADHYRESVIQSLEKEKFHRNVGGMEPTSPLRSGERILTDEACIRMFDLLRLPREAPFRKELVLQARRSGTHSGTAMFFKARLDELTTISTSPFAPVQPKSWAGQVIQAMPPLAVSRGARIHLEACFDPSVSRDIFFHRVTGPT